MARVRELADELRALVLGEVLLEGVEVDEVLHLDHPELAGLALDVVAAELGLLADEVLADHLGRVRRRRVLVGPTAPTVRRQRRRLRRRRRVALDQDLLLGQARDQHVEPVGVEVDHRERLHRLDGHQVGPLGRLVDHRSRCRTRRRSHGPTARRSCGTRTGSRGPRSATCSGRCPPGRSAARPSSARHSVRRSG